MKLKRMYNPPHPGQVIAVDYLEYGGLSIRDLATSLGVAPSTLSRLINGEAGVSAEMAMRLSKALGSPPELWLSMQNKYDLWVASQQVDLSGIKKVKFPTNFRVAEDNA